MATITFDTLAYARKLKQAGFTDQQAEVAAEAQKEAIETVVADLELRHLSDLATRRDIKELELTFAARIAETKAELTRWIIGAGFLQTALITGLILKLMK